MRGLWGPSEHTKRLWAVCLSAFTFWGHMHVVWWLQRYRYWDTDDVDEIYAFGAHLSIHKDFGSCAWAFCPLGTSLCMHIYDEIWDNISSSIHCSSEAWWFPDCPSVEFWVWWDYFPGYLFSDNFHNLVFETTRCYDSFHFYAMLYIMFISVYDL